MEYFSPLLYGLSVKSYPFIYLIIFNYIYSNPVPLRDDGIL